MLLMTSTSDLVRVVTDAAGDIEAHASYLDHDSADDSITPGRTNTASITTATTTTVVASPGSGINRNVKHLNLRNNHASQAVLVTVFHTDGTNQEDLFEVTLLAGEALVFNQAGTWIHYDVNGGMYPQVGAIASQAEMEAASSTVTAVSPGRMHFHPGTNKFWVLFTGNSTTILASYNMTSITDGTTTATVTIATDFSSANWCCQATAEGTTNTVAAARLAWCYTIAAGSILVACCDAAATSAMQDPTRWHVTGLGDQ